MWVRIAVFCLALALVNAIEYKNEFNKFIIDFNKKYDDVAYAKRYEIFKANLQYIEEFNSKNSHMQLGINHMSDMSREEYTSQLMQPKPCPTSPSLQKRWPNLPTSVDWRNQSDVPPVANVAPNTGAIYPVVGSIQSWCSIYAGPVNNFDPQQVVQCIQGGWNATEEQVFEYVEQNGLHDTWTNCNVSRNAPGCCSNAHICFGGQETALAVAVGLMGPTVVTIDADHPSFQSYQTGIYSEPKCNSSNLNFNLLVVGYGATAQGQEYWIAQNYWGTTWGQAGYIYIAKNQNDTCGIGMCPCHPVGVHQCVR